MILDIKRTGGILLMNDVIKNMIERRSCRAYKPEMIKDEELDLILKAGEWAPSGMGKQASVLVAVRDMDTVKKLSDINAKIMGTDGDPFYGAPVVVVVLADTNRPTYVEDGSLILENMMLAATSLGIGSCWIHRAKETFESEEGRALMKKWGVPESYAGVGNVILGYPAEPVKQDKPRKDGRIIKIG